MTSRRHAFFVDVAATGALVERPSPTEAPTAFRIWAAGENMSDEGSIFFTEKSAQLLMAEQTDRGRRYPSDFDHLSLTSNRPAESGRASGWHSLGIRPDATGKPELWAVDIEWCADAKAGLEEQPPRWRYFSPAFLTNKDNEVLSYTNFALCINPLTHQLPALATMRAASIGDKPMNKKALLAALARVCAADTPEDARKEALDALSKHFDELPDGAGDEGDDKKDEKKDAASDEKKDPEPKSDDDKKDEKKDAKHAADGDTTAHALAADLVTANRRIEVLEIREMLTERQDLPESVRSWCQAQTSETVKTFLAKMPKLSTDTTKRHEKPSQGKSGAPELLAGRDREEMDQAMGMRTHSVRLPEHLDDGRFVLHTVRPSDLRAHRAQKGTA